MTVIHIEKDIVLIDKPQEWTSFDAVAKLRGRLSREYLRVTGDKRRIKVGHTGTLDPFATGLLVLAVGKATKEIQSLTKLDKTYVVEAVLGKTSTTGDPEGKISNFPEVDSVFLKKLKIEEVTEVIKKFVGEIEQTPPKYSAIKINGKRAYELARAGKEFKMKPRTAMIHSIYDIELKQNTLRFTCDVGSGTYIRTLVEDVGNELGCGAYTKHLRRTKVGEFSIVDAISVDEIDELCYS